ncbi:hypothetical protein RHMOL_Rhmol05G0275000 [Rhododendron molle]|uniref:Uncharacterized protein n=1 Tax=Rhododendron molle TaxID=49168 RepID=A0ACC0NUR6_RHOML|nr:hypothetical protein RHMOL_Rhmol05G0275000 [Rhododendron molle]
MEARACVSSGEAVDSGGTSKFLQPHHRRHHQQKPSAQIDTVPQLLAGGIAGAFSKTCTAPLARLTILFQVQGMQSEAAALSNPSILREALRIVNEEGFRAFWKGNLVTIVHRLPYSAVNFYAYERYKSFLKSVPGLESHRGSTSADVFAHFIGGGLAGITAASATYPLDLVRTRLAAQINNCKEIRRKLVVVNCSAGGWTQYSNKLFCLRVIEVLLAFSKHLDIRPEDSTAMVSLACGSLSGIASSTATFPLDLFRRRMQLEGAAGQARVYKTGLFGTFKHIFRTEGLRGLYRGILPEYYKVVPGVGIAFMTYETLKKLLSHEPTFSP